ncbi:MAG: hypothetical protein AAGC90_02880 [Curtobacterium sp.]
MVKHRGTIALAAVTLVVLMLAVALIISPRPAQSTTHEDDQTSLTPEQQRRVDDRLDRCFSTGDC